MILMKNNRRSQEKTVAIAIVEVIHFWKWDGITTIMQAPHIRLEKKTKRTEYL